MDRVWSRRGGAGILQPTSPHPCQNDFHISGIDPHSWRTRSLETHRGAPRPTIAQTGFNPSGTIGIDRTRIPVAAKIALPTAGAILMIGVSPAPSLGRSFRSTSTVSSAGASRNRGTRYDEKAGF